MTVATHWDASEDAELRRLFGLGLTDREISARLVGRSVHGICNRRQVLRLLRPTGLADAIVLQPAAGDGDGRHVAALMAHGGLVEGRLRERAAAELRRRGIAA